MTRAFLLDADRSTLGILDPSYTKLSTTERYWDVDVFTVEINRRRLYASQIDVGRFLYLPEEDDAIFLIEQIVSAQEGSPGSDNMVVSGRSLDGLALALRRAIPPAGESHDRQTAVAAETAMKHYVDENAGPAASAAREVPGLTIAPDLARGPTMTTQARYQAVLEVVREIALASGLGWHVPYDPVADAFPFDVIEGVDHTADVFFDFEFDTLERWEELLSIADSSTVAIVAGQGEGVAREVVIRWIGSEPTGLDRREVFVDARDVEPGMTDILEQRGDAFLTVSAPERRLEAKTHQYGSFRFRTHWGVGDLVLVRNVERDLAYSARVIAVESAWDRSAVAPARVAILDRPFPTIPERVNSARAQTGPIIDSGAGGGVTGDDLVYVGTDVGTFDLVRMGA